MGVKSFSLLKCFEKRLDLIAEFWYLINDKSFPAVSGYGNDVSCLRYFGKEVSQLSKKIISTKKAPAAVGPYSQAVSTEALVFASGQIPIDPVTGSVITGDIKIQTRQVLNNLRQVLEAAGSSLDKVVKATVFITNMDDFPVVNKIYVEFFPADPPARACVEVSRLPKGVNIEIEAVALL